VPGVVAETLVVVDFVTLVSPVGLTVVSGILVEQSSTKTCWSEILKYEHIHLQQIKKINL